MKYLICACIGLILGIILYIVWKKIFGKYLPLEDAFLLKLICAIGYYLVGIINGALFASLNIYAICVGLFLLLIVFAISYGFGLYYKVIAPKKINV